MNAGADVSMKKFASQPGSTHIVVESKEVGSPFPHGTAPDK
jgi:hypothetical protein